MEKSTHGKPPTRERRAPGLLGCVGRSAAVPSCLPGCWKIAPSRGGRAGFEPRRRAGQRNKTSYFFLSPLLAGLKTRPSAVLKDLSANRCAPGGAGKTPTTYPD